MPKPHRLLSAAGGVAAALAAGFALPAALGHADSTDGGAGGTTFETCDGAVCLVQDPGHLDDWSYQGVRPVITHWQGTQPYTVEDNGTDLGSYSIAAQDNWSPFYSIQHYTYGDFTPNPDAPSGTDLGGFADLSGAQVYDTSLFGGAFEQLSLSDVVQHGHELTYEITTIGNFTNTTVIDVVNHTSGDYIQFGDSDPEWVYNSLFHGNFFPVAPDYVVPADQFALPDFDPGDFVGGGDLAGI